MSEAPAALARLDQKGRLAVGADADFVIWDPDAAFAVHGERLSHRHPLTPYDGLTLAGVVEQTYLRGECVWRSDRLERQHHGRLL
jgi:allantoinase